MVKAPKFLGSVNLFVYLYPKTWHEEEDMSCVPYASVVISLMYGIVYTRRNIAHAMEVLSMYM